MKGGNFFLMKYSVFIDEVSYNQAALDPNPVDFACKFFLYEIVKRMPLHTNIVSYYKEQVGKFAEYRTAPLVQEGYEVSVQD